MLADLFIVPPLIFGFYRVLPLAAWSRPRSIRRQSQSILGMLLAAILTALPLPWVWSFTFRGLRISLIVKSQFFLYLHSQSFIIDQFSATQGSSWSLQTYRYRSGRNPKISIILSLIDGAPPLPPPEESWHSVYGLFWFGDSPCSSNGRVLDACWCSSLIAPLATSNKADYQYFLQTRKLAKYWSSFGWTN